MLEQSAVQTADGAANKAASPSESAEMLAQASTSVARVTETGAAPTEGADEFARWSEGQGSRLSTAAAAPAVARTSAVTEAAAATAAATAAANADAASASATAATAAAAATATTAPTGEVQDTLLIWTNGRWTRRRPREPGWGQRPAPSRTLVLPGDQMP